jgi:capsular polysaccharide biosynthesis protein
MTYDSGNSSIQRGQSPMELRASEAGRPNLAQTSGAPSASDSAYLDIVHFLRVIFRNLWLIILVAIIGGAAGYFLVEAQTPVYESLASVAVLPNTSGSTTIPRPLENINVALGTYVQVLRSTSLQDSVKAVLAQEFTAEELREAEIEVQPIENSSIISIAVRSANRELAEAFATGLMSQVMNENPLPLFQLSYRVYVLDSASSPTRPAYPNKQVSLVLAVLGSVVLGVALAFLRDTYQRRRREQRAASPVPR